MIYRVLAQYARHLESQLVLAIAECGRDSQRPGTLPADRVDAHLSGETLFVVCTPAELETMLVEAKREGYALALANTGPQPVKEQHREHYRERAAIRIPDVTPIAHPEPLKVAS